MSANNNTNAKESLAQVKQIFAGLMKGERYTPLDVLKLFNCLSANQRFSDLRLQHHVPMNDRFIKLDNGKRVKEHWLEQSYIDAVHAGTITPPSFYKGE